MTEYVFTQLGIDSDELDEPDMDRGLHYPLTYMLQTWADYVKHGTYPRAGGFEAQDPHWIADRDYLTSIYNLFYRQYAPAAFEQYGQQRPRGGDPIERLIGQASNARDWKDTFR